MKYLSKYSNDKLVMPAQYIVEISCEHKAKRDKKDLHFRFWTNPEWSQYYKNQIATANQMIEKYPEQAIIRAINNKKAENIFSLRAPHLIPIIETEMVLMEQENKVLSVEFDRSENKSFLVSSKDPKSILSKLKELE